MTLRVQTRPKRAIGKGSLAWKQKTNKPAGNKQNKIKPRETAREKRVVTPELLSLQRTDGQEAILGA